MERKKIIRPTIKNKFDYEEDIYDKLSNLEKNRKETPYFKRIKKTEFDYEKDPYEP